MMHFYLSAVIKCSVLSILLIVMLFSTCSAIFALSPINVEISTTSLSSESFARFTCQHDTADIITWLVNDTSLTSLNAGIVTSVFQLPSAAPLNTLMIPARVEYNTTSVVCIALFLDGTAAETSNPPGYLIFFQDNATVTDTLSGFSQEPLYFNSEYILSTDEEPAVFTCQHCETEDIKWRLNRTLIRYDNAEIFQGIDINYSFQPPCGLILELTITNLEKYNKTTIQCEAGEKLYVTQPFVLLVQGELGRVSNLTSYRMQLKGDYNSIIYTWDQPFSLNVTNAEPDIVYCVYIYPTSCNNLMPNETEYQKCNITETMYNIIISNSQDKNILYRIEVLPRINLGIASNGTREKHTEMFVYFEKMTVSYTIDFTVDQFISQIKIMLNLQGINDDVQPGNISLNLTAIDFTNGEVFNCSTDVDMNTTNEVSAMLVVSMSSCSPSLIKTKRLYMANLYVPKVDCSISEPSELSTHVLQNITINQTSEAGKILVSCNIIDTADSVMGFMAIAYPTSDNDPKFHYVVKTRRVDEVHLEATISGLSERQYRVSVFSVHNNGLPFNRSAATARTVSNIIAINDSVSQTDSGIDVNALRNNNDCNGVLLKCSFMDNSTSQDQCVVIISERDQISTEYGLLNIRVYNFSRLGDTASGCLPDLNVSNFLIDVFMFRDQTLIAGVHRRVTSITDAEPDLSEEPPSTQSKVNIFAAILSPVAVITLLCLVGIILIIALYKKGLRSNLVSPTLCQ